MSKTHEIFFFNFHLRKEEYCGLIYPLTFLAVFMELLSGSVCLHTLRPPFNQLFGILTLVRKKE